MEIHNISDIANKLGKEWYVLGVNMGYSKAQLENLREIYPYQPVDRNLVMLFKWSQQVETFGIDTKVLLSECLEETGFKDLAEDILQDESSIDTKASAIPVDERKKLDTAIRNINFDIKEKEQSVFVGQKIKRIINCTKCKNLFRTPKNLPCGHTFCRPCIVSLLKENDKTCPTCKECIMLHTEEDVDGLTTNTLIRDLIAINKKYELWLVNNTSDIPCDRCDKPESFDFCIDCLIYMCRPCSTSHATWPSHKTHRSLEVNSKNEPIIELRKKIPKCNTHEKNVVSFCATCRNGVCDDCRETSHKEHVFEDLHSHCEDKRKEIKNTVTSTETILQNYLDYLEKFDKKEYELGQEKEKALGEVDSIMTLVREVLEKKDRAMRSRIIEKYDKKCQQLHSEKEIIREENMKLLSRIEYLNFLYEYGSDAHIVTECDKNRSCCADTGVKPNLDNLESFAVDFTRNPLLEHEIDRLNLGTLDEYYIDDDFEPEEQIYDDAKLESPLNEHAVSSFNPCHSESFEKPSMNIDERSTTPPPSTNGHGHDVGKQRPDSVSLEIPPPHIREFRMQPLYAESSKRVKKKETNNNEQVKMHLLSSNNKEQKMDKERSLQSSKFDHKEHWNATWKPNPSRTNMTSSPRGARMMYDFKCVVSGMAVSCNDIALISFESRCIKIFHYRKNTFSFVSHECKKIEAPFDAVYSEDKDNVTGLFFTETDNNKKGVKILYKKGSQLKLMNFTNRVEDPRGISANHQNVFVCDRSRCRILVFKKDGELILSVSKLYSRFDMPMYVCAAGHERLIVTDPNTNTVSVLSGIEDRCTVIDMYKSSDFKLERTMTPGKCCVDKNDAVLIPDRNNCELLNSRTKQTTNLTFLRNGETPAVVSRLNSREIVVATVTGKLFVY